jgi:hypothetical protein
MDDATRAERIVNALHRGIVHPQPDGEAIAQVIRDESPDSRLLSHVMVLAAARFAGNNRWENVAAVVESLLSSALTAEHVAAQEKMSAAADTLAKASHRLAGTAFWINWLSLSVAIAALVVSALVASAQR